MDNNGGWVFISHSHLDIAIVRKIRNEFEARGFEPLLFYLKCLSDEDEIENLIRREIDEREWFVYVESENSQKSKWVQSERAYIESLRDKKIFTIDLSRDIYPQIDAITRQLQIFVDYLPEDSALGEAITKLLVEKEYLVFHAGQYQKGEATKTNAALYTGFVLFTVTENSCDSPIIREELQKTIQERGNFVPVYVDHAEMRDEEYDISGGFDVFGIPISSRFDEHDQDELLFGLAFRMRLNQSHFSTGYGFRSATVIRYPAESKIESYIFWACDVLETVIIPDSVTYISDKAFRPDQDVLIQCRKGSCAEAFCIAHGMRCEIIP